MATKQKSIKKNFLLNAVLMMSSFIFPLITFPYVSRILFPVGTGKVSFATSLISYFTMFSQLGIPTYGIRACAKVRDDREELTRTAHELIFINLVTSILSYIILAAGLIYIPRLQEEKTLYIIVSATIFLTALGMEWLYKALEQYTYITIRSIFFKILALITMFMLIHEQKDYVIYGGISIFASSASNILNLFNVHKHIEMKLVGNYGFKRHFKPIAVFFAMACATTIYTNLDTVMLGFITTDEDVGYYNAAIRIKSILVSIVTSLGTVLLPRSSYFIEHKQLEDFKRVSLKALNFVFLIACPMTLYFILFAKYGIYFLSGNAYSESILPMQIIMPTLIFIGVTNILGIQILVPLGKEKIVLFSELAGAITDVILNAILIPRMASAGAAIGTLVAELIVLIIQYTALRTWVFAMLRRIHYVKISIGLALGTIASIWVSMLKLHSFFILAISACLFFGTYGIYLLITKEQLIIEIFDQLHVLFSKRCRKSNNRERVRRLSVEYKPSDKIENTK